jgi:adsorption protein B
MLRWGARHDPSLSDFAAARVTGNFMAGAAAELALFAAVGFLLFSADDLIVDLLYLARRLTDGREKLDLASLGQPLQPGWMVVTIPAWDEAAVIAPMLRATLDRLDHPDFTLLVGHYRNDPATAAAISSVDDPRVLAVEVPANGPTTKADCLNHLYSALMQLEAERGRSAKAMVLHDAEDLVHPQELRIFDTLSERAALVQLPVVPLIDPASNWVAGHYCDEFAESHGKDLVVREAVGAAVPLAGVGCAIARDMLAKLAAENGGKPFAGGSMTEDYEMGLRSAPWRAAPCSCAWPNPAAARAWSRAAATSPPRLGQQSGRRRAGSAASPLPAGIGWAGVVAGASAGSECATARDRSPPCCCSPATRPPCCGGSWRLRPRWAHRPRPRHRRPCSSF